MDVEHVASVVRTCLCEVLPPPVPRPIVPSHFDEALRIELAPSADDLVPLLLASAEFQMLRLGTFLNTPEGELLEAVAALVVPGQPFWVHALAEAMKEATKAQQRQGRAAARQVFVCAVAAIGLVFVVNSAFARSE